MALETFKRLHSIGEKVFTRCRSLTFSVTLLMVMRNSVKSLQNAVNEAMLALGELPVTASAYCQARHKLKHTAFMALNEKAVQRAMYENGDYQTFWGFRVLAVDGSKIRLPNKQALVVHSHFDFVGQFFNTLVIKNEFPLKNQPDNLALTE